MVGLIYCKSGGGKTVNSTLVRAPIKGRNLLMCSDNSEVVLNNFDRPNLDIEKITHCVKSRTDPSDDTYLTAQIENLVETGKYDNLIVDNISDLFDMWILELDEIGNSKDKRQDYQLVYQNLKRIVRKATMYNCNVIFTAWLNITQLSDPSGKPYYQYSPKIPDKILDNICGLCNIVGMVQQTIDDKGNSIWFYNLKPTKEIYAKDQLFNRTACKPESLFDGGKVKKENNK